MDVGTLLIVNTFLPLVYLQFLSKNLFSIHLIKSIMIHLDVPDDKVISDFVGQKTVLVLPPSYFIINNCFTFFLISSIRNGKDHNNKYLRDFI